MKRFIAVIFLALLSSCAVTGSTVGDGVFDAREQAYFRVAVGGTLSIFPTAVAPVYLATVGILSGLDQDSVATNPALYELIDSKIPAADPAVGDLIVLLKAEIFSVLDGSQIPGADRLPVVKQMLQIIQQSAAARK